MRRVKRRHARVARMRREKASALNSQYNQQGRSQVCIDGEQAEAILNLSIRTFLKLLNTVEISSIVNCFNFLRDFINISIILKGF